MNVFVQTCLKIKTDTKRIILQVPEDTDPSSTTNKSKSNTNQINQEGQRGETEDSHEQDADNEYLDEEDIERFLQNEQETASEGNLMNTSSNFKPQLGM